MEYLYHLALGASLASTYPVPMKRMACLVAQGGSVRGVATNTLRAHAEARALRPHVDHAGATLYVARANGRVSRPCAACWTKLRTAGIRTVVYVNTHGNLTKERVTY